MYNKIYDIENFIEQKIRELLEEPMNENQAPNWAQATVLFERMIIPSDFISLIDKFVKLAKDIIKEAKQHDNKVYYYGIKDGKKIPAQISDHIDFINQIKEWIKKHKDE